MKRFFLLLFTLIFLVQIVLAQRSWNNGSWRDIYRAFPEKKNDMVHTKLEAGFDYQKSQLNGKVWLTIKPHFYPVDSLKLDAKGMDIHSVQLVEAAANTPLKYDYDNLILNIDLGRKFYRGEEYTVYIEYTAKPNELRVRGRIANNAAKGLYFINPDGKDKDKPTQIWTQGETESNSAWIPLIDKPDQKSTEEMILTVPDKYVTLSNGSLVNQNINPDGTRTDTWKMDLPHAPYLFFIGVGDYAVVKDSYKGKEVSYYVEKPYKDVARKIFGETPEMIAFFSEKLGVEYPWVKYSQMTARDFVSGAMENTTATLHNDRAQQNARQLTDINNWETTIAHELFHQWFGDLVTCESWSNITVNESFADFSEGLWMGYKHGEDEGQAEYFNGLRTFLSSRPDSNKVLVRYYYADKEDIFDRVSYQKGGSVLLMLENFVGEDAFFQSLNTYLTRNRFGIGNAHKLQQAFEDVTGKDLNWFFNQWYYSAGYPELDISYGYDEQNHTALVYTKQKQTKRLFKLPVNIDVYEGKNAVRYSEWISNATDTFRFEVSNKPDLINVDADKTLVAHKTDHKTLGEYIFQYQNGKNYVDRWEAIDYASTHTDEDGVIAFLKSALKDSNYRLRIKTLRVLKSLGLDKDILADVVEMVKTDPSKLVMADAIAVLNAQNDKKYKKLFISCLQDSSYSVAGAAYSALINLDEKEALSWLPKLDTDALGTLRSAVKEAEFLNKTDADFDDMYTWISDLNTRGKYQNLNNFISYLGRVNDAANFGKGIVKVLEIRDELSNFVPSINEDVRRGLTKIKEEKEKQKPKGELKNELEDQLKLLDEILNKGEA